MTRREVERVAAAVRRISEAPEEQTPANISLQIGRAVLGAGASVEAWTKWLLSCGWPKNLAPEMARAEVEE